jgi:hypothetical protein
LALEYSIVEFAPREIVGLLRLFIEVDNNPENPVVLEVLNNPLITILPEVPKLITLVLSSITDPSNTLIESPLSIDIFFPFVLKILPIVISPIKILPVTFVADIVSFKLTPAGLFIFIFP